MTKKAADTHDHAKADTKPQTDQTLPGAEPIQDSRPGDDKDPLKDPNKAVLGDGSGKIVDLPTPIE